MQNKCIRFCLKLDKMHHISEDFKTINWLSVDQRVQQSLNVTVFKHVNNAYALITWNKSLNMLHKIYIQEINSRNNYARLKVPFRKTTIGQKSLTYIGPSVWNKLPNSMKRNISLNKFKHSMKRNISLNKFKHDVKKHYLRELRV